MPRWVRATLNCWKQMPFTLTRRRALAAIASATLPVSRLTTAADAAEDLDLGPPRPFDFDRLTAIARGLAAKPYLPPVITDRDTLNRIDFDAQMDITYRPERTIMPDTPTPIRLFHLHRYAKEGVHIFLVENGSAREIIYRPELVAFGPE